MADKTVFAQLFQLIPAYEFNICVEKYNGNKGVRSFSCWDQYLAMTFAQLTRRSGMRDIEACLNSHKHKLYQMGFRGRVSRSTLSEANSRRDYKIFQYFSLYLINRTKSLYENDDFILELNQAVYALDSTTIDLCLSMFPWAHFRKTKAAVKAHTLLDLRGSIPTFIALTTGKVHDVFALDLVTLEPGSIITMDRAYNDFKRLYTLHQQHLFFVIRAKKDLSYKRVKTYRESDKEKGVRSDQLIKLTGVTTASAYPEYLRRITFVDLNRNKRLTFITNNLSLSAVTIAKKEQVFTNKISLHTFLHILEVNIFEQRPINQIVTDAMNQESERAFSNQLSLLDF